MSRQRLVLLVVLTVLIAVIALFVKLPLVVERIAFSKLSEIGAKEISIEFTDVSLGKTKLGRLGFILEYNARRYQVSSRDIEVSYNLFDLISGDLNKVTVPDISVLVEALPTSKLDEQSTIPNPTNWLAGLPFNDLDLKHLTLKLVDVDKQTLIADINGRLKVASNSASGSFDIQNNQFGSQRLEFDLVPLGLTQLSISSVSTDASTIKYLELSSNHWQVIKGELRSIVGIDIDIQSLQQQLQLWGIQELPRGTKGRLTIQGQLVVSSNSESSWQPKGRLKLDVPKLKNLGNDLLINAPIELALSREQLQLSIGKTGQVSLKGIKLASMSIKSVQAKLISQLGCYVEFEKKNWSCEPFKLEVRAPLIKQKQNIINTSTAAIEFTSLAGDLSTWSAELGVDIPTWVIKAGKEKLVKNIMLDRVKGTIKASNEKVHAMLALVAAEGGVMMHVNATHMIKSRKGKAQYRLEPVDMQQNSRVFANIYSDWPPELVLNEGTIGLAGDASWWQGDLLPIKQATLIIQSLSGAYDEFTFAGLTGTLDASGLNTLRIKSRKELNLARLNVGAPITDIALKAEVLLQKERAPILKVSDLVMNSLGGQMTSKQIKLDLARKKNPFTVKVKGIDVAELLKLEQKQGLIGTGVIDGELPLIMTDEGISMQNGYLGARKPGGNLRYSADDSVRNMAKSNAGVELLLVAMEDFTYKVLEAVVDYTPDGLLKFKIRIEGSNPELEGGRSVHLNADVENNVLELLRSLRLANEISDTIGDQVRKRQLGK